MLLLEIFLSNFLLFYVFRVEKKNYFKINFYTIGMRVDKIQQYPNLYELKKKYKPYFWSTLIIIII